MASVVATPASLVLGTNTVTWTVTDGSGLTATSTQTVTVIDAQNPTIATLGPISVNADAGVCTYASSQLTAPATGDNCSVASVVATPSSLVLGTNTVTWTVTDGSGLTATSTQTVTVIDAQNPTIATLGPISVNADAGVCTYASSQLTAPATDDNCSVVSTVATPASLVLGTNTVTWTVTDGSGLTAVSTQTVTVIDAQNPTIATLGPISVNADAGVCTYASSQLTAPATGDNCSVANVVATPASLVLGTNTVTWTVTDGSGLTAVSIQTVTVIDAQNPTIATLGPISVNADAGVCTYASSQLTAPVTGDNCSVASVVATPASLVLGTNTVTWTVTDGSGLTATSTQAVTVIDNQYPTVTAASDVVTTTSVDGTGNCTAAVAVSDAIYGDNCSSSLAWVMTGAVSASGNGQVGTYTFPIGLTTITYTVTDGSLLTTTDALIVTITDDELPTITCPTPTNPYTVNNGCTWTGAGLDAVIGDNCGIPTLSYSINSGAYIAGNANGYNFPIGTTNVTYRVVDASGNIASCSFAIIVHGITVSGVVNYFNTANTPMNNVTVKLKQGGTDIYSTTTTSLPDTPGLYSFTDVCAGNYDVVFTTGKATGGINSSDAAQVNAWGVLASAGSAYPIEKVRFFAGDVLKNNVLNAGDAGRILNYFVSGGADPIVPNWTFWRTGETTTTQNPLPNVLTISIPNGSGPIVQNYYAMVSGDFNMSFTPGSTKAVENNVILNIGGTMIVDAGVDFELPVVAGMDMQIGAISLIINFPTDKLEVSGVYLGTDPDNTMEYALVDNELRIGWNSLIPISLSTGEALLTLKLRTIGAMAQGETIRLSLTSDPLNELADGDYNTILNALLFVDEIGGTETSVPGVSLNGKLLLESYPNPFVNNVTFAYTLPKEGKVVLEISTMLGSKSDVLLDEWQTAGDHTYTVDMSKYSVGVYTATLKLQSKDDECSRTIKVIRGH